jgi:glucose-6-phosphate 1-epimerase
MILEQQEKNAADALTYNRTLNCRSVMFAASRDHDNTVVATLLVPGTSLTAKVCCAGAHVLSATAKEGGRDLFFLSETTKYPPGSPIRGGNPLVLGWFGGRQGSPSHGFGRVLPWTPIEASHQDGVTKLILELTNEALKEDERFKNDPIWSKHSFRALMTITLCAETGLTQEVAFTNNNGDTPIELQAGFHPYFNVSNYQSVSVEGLEVLPSLNALNKKTEEGALNAPLTFNGAMDRIHFAPEGTTLPQQARIIDNAFERTIVIEQHGHTEWVTWNPGDSFASLNKAWAADISGNITFVCVEPMIARGVVTVEPGKSYIFGIKIKER